MIRKSIGKYRVVDKQDRGETGTIYRAVDETTGREVALKILSADLENHDLFNRFRADAAVLAALNHHELAALYEVTSGDGHLLIVMELVRGESLAQLLKRSGPVPPERAGYLVWQVLGALSPAHDAGLVHRDIRPSNLMVVGGGVKILDFGLAILAEAERTTTDISLAETPVYMAPEQLQSQEVDRRADLYSCGVVFYNLLTGALPFKSVSRVELMDVIVNVAPTPVSTYLPDLPDWCGQLIDKALAKAPSDRFQTAEEFRTALTTAIGSAAGMPARKLSTPAVFEGAPTVIMRSPAPVASVTPAAVAAAPVTAAPAAAAVNASAPPGPIAPQPPGLPVQRARVVKMPTRKQLVVAAAGLAVLVAAGVTYNFSTRQSAPAADVAQNGTAAAPTSPVATQTAPAAPPVITTPAAPAPLAPPVPKNTSAPPPPPPPTAAKVVTRPPADAPLADAPPAPKTATAVAPPVKSTAVAFPAAVFDADAVVADGDRHRERDGRLVMADGSITVMQKSDSVIATFPIDGITRVSYSTARHPLWNSPTGPAEVLRVDGGAFGILRGGRNWLAFHTADAVHIVRIKDEDIQGAIAALEARTGRPVERVAVGKD